MENTKKIYVFLIVITLVVVLIYAQSIIIPFILAILFWFLIRVIKKLLSKMKIIDRLPKWILTLFSTIILIGFLALIITMISKNIQHLSTTMPVYQANVNKIANSINERFEIDIISMTNDYAKDINFATVLPSLFSALRGIFGRTFTVLLYLIFLLLEEPVFNVKLKAMYPDKKRYKNINALIGKIDQSIGNYIALKTLTSLTTGFLSYFALLFIGIDAPLFWAFLIFVLNFPNGVGSSSP